MPERRHVPLMRWLHKWTPDVRVPEQITPGEALEGLRAAGCERVVNLLFPLRAGEADELHAFGAELAQREPDVVCLGGVHAEDPDPAGVVRRAIEDHGMRGMKLHPMVQRFTPGHPALEPALQALAAYGLPLYVHTGFDEWYGYSYPLSELEVIAERHPQIPLVLCHANVRRLAWAAQMARRHDHVWLDLTNTLYATLHDTEPSELDGQLAAYADLYAAALLACRARCLTSIRVPPSSSAWAR